MGDWNETCMQLASIYSDVIQVIFSRLHRHALAVSVDKHVLHKVRNDRSIFKYSLTA